MPEQALDTVRMSRGTALAMNSALAALVQERLPLTVQTDDPAKPMRLIGPAMFARGAGTVQAIGKLAPLNREADAGVLLRVLLEHMITFAWLAADEDNKRFALWLKQRLKMHNDLPGELDELLPGGAVRRHSRQCRERPTGPSSAGATRRRCRGRAQHRRMRPIVL